MLKILMTMLLLFGSLNAAIPISERTALINFYNSLNGDDWYLPYENTTTRVKWKNSDGTFKDVGTECN